MGCKIDDRLGDARGVINLLDLKTKQTNKTIAHNDQGIKSLGFTSHGQTLISIGEDSKINIWEVT